MAIRHNTDLKLDLSILENRQEGMTSRVYELKHVNIKATIATPLEVAEFTGEYKNRLQATLVRLRQTVGLAVSYPNVYVERHFHFDPAVLDVTDNSYLDGYWQSEKYFKDIADIIRNEFIVITGQDEWSRHLAEEIKATESVSIHVRRGDYINNIKTSQILSSCSLDYYKTSSGLIATSVSNPTFFIFSDDMEWVKKNFTINFRHFYVEHNGDESSYMDMYLMSLCKHNIIANSSFSWWGAWLNRNPNKQVIAPARWFQSRKYDVKDLLPASWVKV